MIKLDSYIIEFISNNWMAMTIFLTLLKGVAKMTKSTKDDQIATMLSNLFNGLRRQKP